MTIPLTAIKVINVLDLIFSLFYIFLNCFLEYQSGGLIQHHQIKVGRSPVGNNDDSNNSTGPSSPTNYMQNQQHLNFSNLSVESDGEMVVFDDIDSNWQNKNPLSSPVLSDNESCLSSRDVENYYEIDTKANDDSKGQRIIGGGFLLDVLFRLLTFFFNFRVRRISTTIRTLVQTQFSWRVCRLSKTIW